MPYIVKFKIMESTETTATIPNMRTLTSCLELLKNEGYTEDLKVSDGVLTALQQGTTYIPSEIKVNNFYRFEGPSSPDDNCILYAIETQDGIKGTLIDAYGVYADEEVGSFMLNVEDIQKKVAG